MNRKKIKLALKILLPIAAAGAIGYSLIFMTAYGPSKPKTVIITSETVKEDLSAKGNFQVIKKEIIQIPKKTTKVGFFLDNDKILIYKKIKDVKDDSNANSAVGYENTDRAYSLDLNTLKEERISEDENPKKWSSVFYRDKSKLYFDSSYYVENKAKNGFDDVDEYYTYDLLTKERTKLNNNTFFSNLKYANLSQDSKYGIAEGNPNKNSENTSFIFCDIAKQQVKILNLKTDGLKILAYECYTDGNYIYFAAYKKISSPNPINILTNEKQYKMALYKAPINNPNNFIEIFSFPTVKAHDDNEFDNTFTQIRNITFLDDERILFEGGYNKDTGIFIFNQATKKLYKVSSDIMLPCDTILYNRYFLSGDKSKIAYLKYEDVGGKKQFNTYVATISGNSLVQNTKILENCNYWNAYWSPDGKKLMVFQDLDVAHDWALGSNNSKLHMITFK